jgi:uncharacterized protein (DUF433 family)
MMNRAENDFIEMGDDGVHRIAGTHVTLDAIVHAFNLGYTATEVVEQHPELQLADVYAAIAYYLNGGTPLDAA